METPPIENPENQPVKPPGKFDPLLLTGPMVVNLIAIPLNALGFIVLTSQIIHFAPGQEYAIGRLQGKLWILVFICTGIAIYHWFKGPESHKRQAKIAIIAGLVNVVAAILFILFAP